ncbi:hypothetical protein FE257_009853 [Aspergillus nanangensis]|uniref:4a-hydroxytetrahydrobiopterin dehydratase n=1 Tax=Aspergillus nanangensis TaxID=2582783 RepID=A0AAD4CVW1_ASPNN|nr:hypothetical protein FE257_009853 [Aspergillus nanangensis]
MNTQPQFAEGTDIAQSQSGLDALTQSGWTLDAEGSGIQKTFYFRTYFKSVSFINVIASQSASKKHHPTMTSRIGSVDVHWTTHHPRGLTEKDIAMAEYCEEAAGLTGAVEQEQGKKCGPTPGSGV